MPDVLKLKKFYGDEEKEIEVHITKFKGPKQWLGGFKNPNTGII